MKWSVKISARKAGAIGALGTEKRTYIVTANSRQAAQDAARKRAYDEGLEHVFCGETVNYAE